jgi:UDP:flavonoid glycosyltransferase YjiC (YdhE family)
MIFSNVAALVGVHVGAALDVPMISSALQPIVPTKAYSYSAGVHVPERMPFRGTLNKLTYKISYRFLYRLFFDMINQGREELLGLPPLPWRMFANLDLSHYPILHGFSRHVVPFPPDYDQFQIFTGYWFLEQDKDYSPPETLRRFLAEEPRPVYVGFGSMVDKETDALTELVVEALALARQRAVLLGGWTDLGGSGLPETVLKVGNVPHEWLFPQVAATVIHGGAGTTAASLQAGTPTVVVPYFADQPFWGRRVAKLGAGPTPVPRQKLTAKKLAAAITQAVEDPNIRQRAAELGEKLRAEDGVANAVRAVDELLATRMDSMMPEEQLKTGKR